MSTLAEILSDHHVHVFNNEVTLYLCLKQTKQKMQQTTFKFLLLSFKAEDSHETSSLIFSEKH